MVDSKKRPSIKTDEPTMKRIMKLMKKAPGLPYKTKAAFAREAINSKLDEIEKEIRDKKLEQFDPTKHFYDMAQLKQRVEKIEDEQKNDLDVVNTLMYIANGKDWGYSKKDIDELWKDLIPKLRPILKQINEKL